MSSTQRHEIEAWLGDDHGLRDDQILELTAEAALIAERYPDPDDQAERDAALTTAYRLMVEGGGTVVEDLAVRLRSARTAEIETMAGLRQAAVTLIGPGDETESGFARAAGVHRSAVREWLGKRQR